MISPSGHQRCNTSVLNRAHEVLREHSNDDVRIVAAALHQILIGECLPADALGLRVAAGRRSWVTNEKLRRRNRLLRDAAREHQNGLPTKVQAERIATAMSRYAASAWLRDQHLDGCPARYAGHLNSLLWAALKQHPEPLSSSRIRAILSKL